MDIRVKTAVAIGNFDGVHIGHQKLIGELLVQAKENSLTPFIYTFKEHPQNTLKGDETVKAVTDNKEKEEIFIKLGVSDFVFEDFSRVRELEPEEFVKKILVDKLNIKIAVVGENNRFGKDAEGNVGLLKKLGEKYGFSVIEVKPLVVDNEVCSSSGIRRAIENGNLEKVWKITERPFSVKGEVISGKELGRTYGFPTANIIYPDGKVKLKEGVYATSTKIDDKVCMSITNVGRTSFDKEKIERVETHIIDFDEDIYGKEISVSFIKLLREFVPFKSIDELEKQLAKDREKRMKLEVEL